MLSIIIVIISWKKRKVIQSEKKSGVRKVDNCEGKDWPFESIIF